MNSSNSVKSSTSVEASSSSVKKVQHYTTQHMDCSPKSYIMNDTPECHTNFFPVQSMAQECDDYGYLMFPGLYPDYEYTTFTPQQMEIIRTYLASNPH